MKQYLSIIQGLQKNKNGHVQLFVGKYLHHDEEYVNHKEVCAELNAKRAEGKAENVKKTWLGTDD